MHELVFVGKLFLHSYALPGATWKYADNPPKPTSGLQTTSRAGSQRFLLDKRLKRCVRWWKIFRIV